jgi:hypothetical protein
MLIQHFLKNIEKNIGLAFEKNLDKNVGQHFKKC